MRNTINNNNDTIYPFKEAFGYDIYFISNLKLAIKDTSIKASLVAVSFLLLKNKKLFLKFSLIRPDYNILLGSITLDNVKWGTIDTLYLFGFVYLDNIPSHLLLINENLFLLNDVFTSAIQNTMFYGFISQENDKANSNNINIITTGNIKAIQKEDKILIQRIEEPLYQYSNLTLFSSYFILSLNNIHTKYLRIISADSNKISVNMVLNTIYINSELNFPGCSNKLVL